MEVFGEVGEQAEMTERPDDRQRAVGGQVAQPGGQVLDGAVALADPEGRTAGGFHQVEDFLTLLLPDDVPEDGSEIADVLADSRDDLRGIHVRRHDGYSRARDRMSGWCLWRGFGHAAIVPRFPHPCRVPTPPRDAPSAGHLPVTCRSGLGCRSAEPGEVLTVEAGAADECTVDIRLTDDLGDGTGLH